jgi:AraC-like DNA-binding protein
METRQYGDHVKPILVNDRVGLFFLSPGGSLEAPFPGWVLIVCLSGGVCHGPGFRGVAGICYGFPNLEQAPIASEGEVLVAVFLPALAGAVAGNIESEIDLPMSRCIRFILDVPLPSPAGSVLQEAKAIELLGHLLAAAAVVRPPYRYCKTEYDRERLLFARDYLLSRLEFPPTIPELARIAGINAFKLKNGFKELFGSPIHRFVTAHKLESARRTLATGAKSPSQLAFDLGFSSLQHFSMAYRKYFGHPPRKK